MSAPQALRATSLRDSLAKTVRLLTRQGIDVQFRGHQPYVQTKGNKATRLVLPELNDNAPAELIEAIQGFLDHEVGHIFYTPFARGVKFANGSQRRHSLCNIIEDIRLEKLLPRELPGTKENLERMYDSVMDTFFGKVALKANEPGCDKSEAFSCVMVCALRGLAGQKAFQAFMDKHNLWPHFMPLIKKMPNISRRLRDLETFDDVESLVEDILEAIKPPPPPPGQKDKPQDDDKLDHKCTQPSDDPDGDDEQDDSASDSSPDGDSDQSDESEDGDDEDESDSSSSKGKSKKSDKDEDEDSDDGEGHGDGEGTDDGNPDDEEEGSSSGDGDGDDEGDGDGDDEGDGDGDTENGDDGDDTDDGQSEDREDGDSAGEGGNEHRTLKEALALLEPKHRRALFLYKKKRQTVAQIADDLEVSEEETRDMLAQARRQVRDYLNGG